MSNISKRKLKKPKIALLVNAFWNSGEGISGGDQRLAQVFSRIGNKFEIDLYTSNDGKKVMAEVVRDAKIIVSPKEFEKGNIFLRYCRRSKWLTKELINHKYDIVYSSSDFFPDVAPAYAYKRKNPGAKWLACIFHIYPHWHKRPGNKIVNLVGSKIQQSSFRKICKLADKVININYQVRDELVFKYHFQKVKISVNPCGIDFLHFKKIKAIKKGNQACFLARLMPSKGIFDLPQIWKEVVSSVPEARLKVIGGGGKEIKRKLSSLFKEAGVEKSVEILGFLKNNQAYKVLKESSVFIFPSHEEGFGIAIAEAFACSVPVVAWDLLVYKEVFPKGLLTAPVGDSKEFALLVSSLLKNKEKNQKLVKNGQEVIKKYHWDEISFVEKNIIENVLNLKR